MPLIRTSATSRSPSTRSKSSTNSYPGTARNWLVLKAKNRNSAATTSTTAPMTLSIRFPLMARFPGDRGSRCGLSRGPGLVIAGGAWAMPAAQHRARRVVGLRRPGQVRLMRLLPRVTLARLRHLVDHVMQPGMPFRRHLRALRLAVVDDPAPFAAEAPAPEPPRLVAFQPVVAVAVIVGTHERAPQPGQ